MKSVKTFSFALIAVLAFAASCNKATYRKTAGGMPYQLFESGDTVNVAPRTIIKFSFTQKINDSVYFTTSGKPPFYTPVSENSTPYDISELWTKLHVGDSVVAVQMMDTFLKRSPGQMPEHFKRGDRIITYVKILGVFSTPEDATQDELKEKEMFAERESKEVARYLADKKNTAQKTPSGAFIEIIDPGTGAPADSGKYVYVNYTGTSFSGVRFDSNTDTSFHHVEPYPFTAGAAEMIKGFDEAVMFLKKGGKARAYIPSMLGYGPRPTSPLIKPYEHLIFDIELLDVLDARPVQPGMRNPPPAIDQSQRKN